MQFSHDYFDKIRPYNADEIPPALKRIVEDPLFPRFVGFLFPEMSADKLKGVIMQCRTTKELQHNIMHGIFRTIVDKTSDGLTVEGIQNISPDKAYTYIANHRDIVLDSSLLGLVLVKAGFDSAEISFGSNLMVSPVISDIWKVNKMFTVFRGGTNREKLQNSLLLSEYIRYTITEKKQSIWIAQRSGRAKDGNDKTEPGLLKMLYTSKRDVSLEKNLGELNIIPTSISYEFEPCDHLKVQEIYTSSRQDYEKKPREDVKSMVAGILQQKGRIRLAIGKPLGIDDFGHIEYNSINDFFEKLAEKIDRQIYMNYHLWPNNYIAYDLLNASNLYRKEYTPSQKEKFWNYIKEKIQGLQGDENDLEQLFLQLYANPVRNKFQIEGGLS